MLHNSFFPSYLFIFLDHIFISFFSSLDFHIVFFFFFIYSDSLGLYHFHFQRKRLLPAFNNSNLYYLLFSDFFFFLMCVVFAKTIAQDFIILHREISWVEISVCRRCSYVKMYFFFFSLSRSFPLLS